MVTASKLDNQAISIDEFLQLPDIEESPGWELIDGKVQQKPMPGIQHSRLQFRLCEAINHASKTYEALPELRCTVENRSLIPDIAIIENAQLPLDETGEIAATGINFAPPWIIEILSPNQREIRVTRNLLYLLRHGGQLGWLIDPQEKCVLVFFPNQLPYELTRNEILPVLPGVNLELSVNHLFAWLKR